MIPKNDGSSEVTVNFKGGGSFTDLPPVFSSDGESVFVSWKSSILEYNTTTGKLVHEYRGLSGNVVGFACHVFDTYPCITTCSENGHILLWKTLTHYKLFERILPIKAVKTFHILPGEGELVALISFVAKSNRFVKFTKADLIEKKSNNYSFTLDINRPFKIDISSDYFAVVAANAAYFLKFNPSEKLSKVLTQDDKSFTCVACHKNDKTVLTGDTLGRVLVWRNLFEERKVQTVFHWHTLPVQCVSFSPAGGYFYSGGGENVLVKWQLDNSHDRRYVPRVAAEIFQISVANNNASLAIATKDNAIRIFNNALNQTCLIQHLVVGNHYECGIVYDSRTRSLMMNGNLGCVQFYSPDHMSLLYNVDVMGQNKITNERDTIMINTEITKLALSKNGLWMATVEERRDPDRQYEIRLKFWRFDEEKQTFVLNTSVDYPHEKSINAIMFQPANKDEALRCVTVGDDAKFKIWLLEDISVLKKDQIWLCTSVGFHRNLSCRSLSFSIDGSLMAIAFRSILTLWVPTTCELKSSLVHRIHNEDLTQVAFGHGPHCHLIVTASESQVSVWNLLTLSMVWTVPVKVDMLIADPVCYHMAVFTKDRHVFVFTPDSHVPLYSSKENGGTILVNQQDRPLAAAFVPTKFHNDTRLKWYERTNIYFIGSNKELYSIGSSDIILDIMDFDFNTLEEEYKYSTPMVEPVTSSSSAKVAVPTKHLFEKDAQHTALKQYLMGSTHTQLPIRLLCHSLLRSLVLEK